MTITYEFENNLYVNTTNRCSCDCVFCLRKNTQTVGNSDSLWLDREPTKEEIWADIDRRDLNAYNHLVFCGFGEPFYRIDNIIWVCEQAKKRAPGLPIRIDTNGHDLLINRADSLEKLAGLVDILSVSLNGKDKEQYNRMSRPADPAHAFDAMLDFCRRAVHVVPRVIMTVVDVIAAQDIEACRGIAQDIGAEFRVREFIK